MQQRVTIILVMPALNSFAPKAAAKYELLFDKLASEQNLNFNNVKQNVERDKETQSDR